MPDTIKAIVGAFEIGVLVAGAVLLWRFVVSPSGRKRLGAPALPHWELAATDFLIFLCLIFTSMFVGALTANAVVKMAGLTGTVATMTAGGGAQLGLLLGVGIFHFGLGHKLTAAVRGGLNVVLSGVATFLVTMPVVLVVSLVWRALLTALGLPTDSQDLVGLFAQAESPLLLAIMIALAALVAPIAEEFIFRAGVFRYLRTRTPRLVALLVPAVVFAALHGNYASFGPLVALAVVFSLAYERTGKIGTTIIAHALFNLNTIMVIFSGLNTMT